MNQMTKRERWLVERFLDGKSLYANQRAEAITLLREAIR